jgi:hypothetical protein
MAFRHALSSSPTLQRDVQTHLIHDFAKYDASLPDPELEEAPPSAENSPSITMGSPSLPQQSKRRRSSAAVPKNGPSETTALLPGKKEPRNEAWILFEYSIPIYITQLLESSFSLVTIVSV